MHGEQTYEIDGVKVSRSAFYAHVQAVKKPRPCIDVNEFEQVTHDGVECRVVMRKDLIRVACTDVTPQAMRHLLKRYEDHFGKSGEIILQAGKE